MNSKPWLPLVVSGAASALCYVLLFTYQKEVMAAFTRTDGWYPMLPVVTALPPYAFSPRRFGSESRPFLTDP